MANLAIIARGSNVFALDLERALRQIRPAFEFNVVQLPDGVPAAGESCLYIPSLLGKEGMLPDLKEAETFFRQWQQLEGSKFIVLSSALIYGAGPRSLSLVSEEHSTAGSASHRIADQWKALELLATRYLQGKTRLTILRPTTVLPSPTLLTRRLVRPLTLTFPGHDPVIQLLRITDLAEAVLCAIERENQGIFNVAPDDVVPLHTAIRMAGSHRLPVPRTLQRLSVPSEALEYLRYPWTVSNKKIREELGFRSGRWSAMAALGLCKGPGAVIVPKPDFDEFGLDKSYVHFFGRTLFKFLSKWYWRVEAKGLEHVPRQGRAVLAGTHRGFMPWDGAMALHLVVQNTGRIPRFLTHPGLLKFPFIANFARRLGGVVACQESAERILENEELLGIFPEGVNGAFALYKNAYQLKSFGRDSFVKLALKYRAPIIPFVTVGSAEMLPIFARIKSLWWTRYSDWPCIPLSTFPFLPVPLPSKFHTEFLPAIHVEQHYGPEAAENTAVVKAISQEVRKQMQHAVDEILRRRKSVFFGSAFGANPDDIDRH